MFKALWYLLILQFCISSQSALLFAEVYLTKEEALKLVCGEGSTYKYEPKTLGDEILNHLDDLNLEPIDKKEAHFFRCLQNKSVAKLALIDAELGKHLPMTYIVGFDKKGAVTRVELMVFREEYGSGVKQRSFMEQFENKDSLSRLKMGSTVRHVSGATISSIGITKGVKRATILWKKFFGKG